MKTNRLFALGLITAVASGACGGDDSGKKVTGDGGSTVTLPDGNVMNVGPDGGGIDGSTPGGDGGGGGDGGQPVTGTGSATITSAGGSVTSADGNLTVTFSRYVFGRPVKVGVVAATNAPMGASGTVYNITPTTEAIATNPPSASSGGYPAPQVLITLKYNDADLHGGNPQDLKLGQYLNNKWVELQSVGSFTTKADPANHTITAQIVNMAPVALMGGVCVACPMSDCKAASGTCNYVDANGNTGTNGKCVELPAMSNCFACRPNTDDDNDNYPLSGDCDNNNAFVHNNAPELCNGIDDNCNQHIDEGCTPCQSDSDCSKSLEACMTTGPSAGTCDVCSTDCTTEGGSCMFGYGADATIGVCHLYGARNTCGKCFAACDTDFDTYCASTDKQQNDCDPANPAVHPQKSEVCGNGIDDNCDGYIDELCNSCSTDADCVATDTVCIGGACQGCSTTCDAAACQYQGTPGTCEPYGKGCMRCINVCDNDKDGYCEGDCDNNDATRSPGLPELCGNSKDDNCNGHVDEGCNPCASPNDCAFQEFCNPEGACDVCNSTTCDPSTCVWTIYNQAGNVSVPGLCVPYGKSCNACQRPTDTDGDGYVTMDVVNMYLMQKPSVDLRNNNNSIGNVDCAEGDATRSPAAPEICGNKVDDNCNGLIDELCTTCEMSAMCGMAEICDDHQ